MENDQSWVRRTYNFYKFIDINIVNAFICIVIGMLVNTFTAGTFNLGYVAAIILLVIVIVLTVFLIIFQGYLKDLIDKTVVTNQNAKLEDRFTTLQDIEIFAIKFDEKKTRRILKTAYWIPPMMLLSLATFRFGYKMDDSGKSAQAKAQQTELDSIRNLCISENVQITNLQNMVVNYERKLDSAKLNAKASDAQNDKNSYRRHRVTANLKPK